MAGAADGLGENNMKKWLKQQSVEKAQEYCKSLILKRKQDKNLLYKTKAFINSTYLLL